MAIKFTEDKSLDRDTYSKAPLSNDRRALLASRAAVKEKLDLKRVQNELNMVKEDLSEIKRMLHSMLGDR